MPSRDRAQWGGKAIGFHKFYYLLCFDQVDLKNVFAEVMVVLAASCQLEAVWQKTCEEQKGLDF